MMFSGLTPMVEQFWVFKHSNYCLPFSLTELLFLIILYLQSWRQCWHQIFSVPVGLVSYPKWYGGFPSLRNNQELFATNDSCVLPSV